MHRGDIWTVVCWCSNTLDWSWKGMNELVWMGNSPDSIFLHLVEEYVMRWCRYTTVKSPCKVVPNVYIGLYRWFVSFGCCWSMLYILGVCVLCQKCLVDWSMCLSAVWICKFSYWQWYICSGYMCIVLYQKLLWCSQAL